MPLSEKISPYEHSCASYTGIWRTSIVAGADHFVKISQSIPLQMAATISINPTTAYRMLKDFVNLKPGTCKF